MEKWAARATNGPRCPEPPPHREAGARRASPVPWGKPSPAAPGTARVPVAALGWAVGQEMVVLGKLRSPHTCARPGLLGEPTTECLSPGMWFSVWMADQPQMGPVTCREERAPGPWAPPALPSLTGEPQAVTRPASPRKACPPGKKAPPCPEDPPGIRDGFLEEEAFERRQKSRLDMQQDSPHPEDPGRQLVGALGGA